MDRTRRLRNNAVLRDMVRENHVRVDELIYPLFVMEGENIVEPVDSMPGICQYSLDRMHEELDRVKEAGIPAILIFGIPAHKDEVGSGAYDEHGIVQEAIRQIKKDYPDLVVIADVCLCEYTSHGHCGLVKDGEILNDETLPLLAASAVSYAKAGADIVAPSDMMDKRVGAIRQALDEAGFTYTPIMAYSAKFASGYYGPFRDAAHSAPGFGDRKTSPPLFAINSASSESFPTFLLTIASKWFCVIGLFKYPVSIIRLRKISTEVTIPDLPDPFIP